MYKRLILIIDIFSGNLVSAMRNIITQNRCHHHTMQYLSKPRSGFNPAPQNRLNTRMHSSRMRTGHSLTICQSLLPRGCMLPRGRGREGVCFPGVCASGEVHASEVMHASLGGACFPGGACFLRGACFWGLRASQGGGYFTGEHACFPRGHVCFSVGCVFPRGACMFPGGHACFPGGMPIPPPPVNRMTDRCKNITLASTFAAAKNRPGSSSKVHMYIPPVHLPSLPQSEK